MSYDGVVFDDQFGADEVLMFTLDVCLSVVFTHHVNCVFDVFVDVFVPVLCNDSDPVHVMCIFLFDGFFLVFMSSTSLLLLMLLLCSDLLMRMFRLLLLLPVFFELHLCCGCSSGDVLSLSDVVFLLLYVDVVLLFLLILFGVASEMLTLWMFILLLLLILACR